MHVCLSKMLLLTFYYPKLWWGWGRQNQHSNFVSNFRKENLLASVKTTTATTRTRSNCKATCFAFSSPRPLKKSFKNNREMDPPLFSMKYYSDGEGEGESVPDGSFCHFSKREVTPFSVQKDSAKEKLSEVAMDGYQVGTIFVSLHIKANAILSPSLLLSSSSSSSSLNPQNDGRQKVLQNVLYQREGDCTYSKQIPIPVLKTWMGKNRIF
ncbi:uncharacterized protein LOC133366246 [Rhineura floridana]|uniref:uncharacterized protein LOC133366246 n=1 Tax=Rhineura floridana TaxID=261503 RepID=UPI002AC83407|nr:uncharacterized protein LOC133366246 [Rhineura floridana]